MDSLTPTTCPFCHTAISAADYFCPNCGKKLKDKPPATTISKQIIVYLVSLLLPPFGIVYAWRYLKQADGKSQKIGIAAVVLTVIALALTIWATKLMIDSINQQLNSFNSS